MIFTFFITIVFIAEIIIALFLISNLYKLDRKINSLDEIITEIKPSFKEILVLSGKISGQIVELTRRYIEKLEQTRDEIIIRQVSKFILSLLFFRRLKKSSLFKSFRKGLSLLEIVI